MAELHSDAHVSRVSNRHPHAQDSWDSLVTRDAVLGMTVHDEGALLAANARAEFESAFISLSRLVSSKVDL